MRLATLIIILNLLIIDEVFSQKKDSVIISSGEIKQKTSTKPEPYNFYLENTISAFNLSAPPNSNFKPPYWMVGYGNSITIKAGFNSKHIFRVGLTDFNDVLGNGNIKFTNTILNERIRRLHFRGNEYRFGYQYNGNNDKKRSVPFLSLEFLFSKFYENYFQDPGTFRQLDTKTKGMIFSLGLKQKIGHVIVINFESGLLLGLSDYTKKIDYINFWPSPTIRKNEVDKKMSFQLFPIKINVGVRIGDITKKKG